MELSVIIVNYNVRQFLENALDVDPSRAGGNPGGGLRR